MTDKAQEKKTGEVELPFRWQQVQSAIWLIGLAILFARGFSLTGLLILLAISGLTQAYFASLAEKEVEAKEAVVAQRTLEETRAVALPEQCPGCGAPLTATTVLWKSSTTAECPYCHAAVKATRPAPSAPAAK